MADDRLMLSALQTNQACSLINNVSQRRCLIHVKLTDLCMKTVENLIDSEKVTPPQDYVEQTMICGNVFFFQGAYFSLWFDENGGVCCCCF